MPIPSLNLALKRTSPVKTRETLIKRETRLPHDDAPAESQTSTRLPQPSSSTQQVPDTLRRRSLLPSRGIPKSATQKIAPITEPTTPSVIEEPSHNHNGDEALSDTSSAQQDTNVPPARVGRPRPQSMYQTTSTRHEQVGQVNDQATRRALRSSTTSEKSAAPSSGLGRSQSVRKPGIPSQSAGRPPVASHVRNNISTSVATTTRREPKSQSERPKSMVIPSSSSARSTGPLGADHKAIERRSSQRTAALKRPVGAKTTKPEGPPSSSSQATVESDKARSHPVGQREPAKEEGKRQARPAFSTLQQHFTPRKVGKAPTSTFLHPPAPDPATCGLPPDIVSLQTELLQLNLLHEGSTQTDQEWERSAKESLHVKFDDVASMYQVMRDNERQGLEQTNLKALRQWSSGNSSFGMTEHIQLISGPLQEVPSLIEPGGRFSKLVNEFSQWTAWVEEIWRSREEGSRNLGSAEGMGDAWKLERAALTRKLTAFSGDLNRLTQPVPGSSISSIVSTCTKLIGGMLDGLQTMQAIEEGVVAREREWVEEELTAIAQDIGVHIDIDEGNEIWRR